MKHLVMLYLLGVHGSCLFCAGLLFITNYLEERLPGNMFAEVLDFLHKLLI